MENSLKFDELHPQFKFVGLPKWPCLVVQGDSVTPEQAMEILIRTNNWSIYTNHKWWRTTIEKLIGVPEFDKEGCIERINKREDAKDKFKKDMGVLPLEYLDNRRVCTSYVGGPHGWCDWEGTIFNSGYNIGKWPNISEIWSEWVNIAEAFPFLNLWCQIYSGEEYEIIYSRPIIEFVVSKGKVVVQEPSVHTLTPKKVERSENMLGREQGCSEEKLKEAINYVRKIRNSVTLDVLPT